MCKKFWWNNLLRCGVPINGHVHGKISLIFSAVMNWNGDQEREHILEVAIEL